MKYIKVRDDCYFPFEIDDSLKDGKFLNINKGGQIHKDGEFTINQVFEAMLDYRDIGNLKLEELKIWSHFRCNSDSFSKLEDEFYKTSTETPT